MQTREETRDWFWCTPCHSHHGPGYHVVTTVAHRVEVKVKTHNHGYPFKAVCDCGWSSPGYVRRFPAEQMAAHHRDTVKGPR